MIAKAQLHIVDRSNRNRAEVASLGFALGHHCEVYGNLTELCAHPPTSGFIIASDALSDRGVGDIIDRLDRLGIWLPLIAVAERPRPSRIVASIKAGALDYLALPLDRDRLERSLDAIASEAEVFESARKKMIEARDRIASLSNREREVLDWLTEGSSNKVIARALNISPRTVEIHRANMMSKLGARHAAEAVRLKFEANLDSLITIVPKN